MQFNTDYLKVSRVLPNRKRASILILLGARWHCQSLLDIELLEQQNFISLLNAHGFDVYCFDNFGTGPTNKTEYCGNKHDLNVALAKEVIERFKIDFVIGYSYGSTIAAELANTSAKGFIFVDPISRIPNNISSQVVDDGDKFLIQISHLKQKLFELTSISSENISRHALKLSVNDSTFLTPSYTIEVTRNFKPVLMSPEFWKSFGDKHVMVAATKHIDHDILTLNLPNLCLFSEASHWIFLEKYAEDLAKCVSAFINKTSLMVSRTEVSYPVD